jgi:hypothetical protein
MAHPTRLLVIQEMNPRRKSVPNVQVLFSLFLGLRPNWKEQPARPTKLRFD